MGAEYNEARIYGQLDDSNYAEIQGDKIIKEALYDYGHAGYTGSFA